MKMSEVAKKERAPRDVDYTVEVFGDLPETQIERTHRFEESLNQIMDKKPLTGDGRPAWTVIAKYNDNGASTAAAATLRKRYGPPEARGWEFAVRKLEGGKRGLFAKYDHTRVVKGAWEKHDRAEQERREKAAEKRKVAKASK